MGFIEAARATRAAFFVERVFKFLFSVQ